jgi:glycosyltransferase involved in cell wall biosynthesis
VSHPIQYFAPLFRLIAAQGDVDLFVLYRSRAGIDEYYDSGFGQTVKWDIPLTSGYRHTFLSKKNTLSGLELSVASALVRERPDVLMVHGYADATNLFAVWIAKAMGTAVLVRGDTRLQTRHLRRFSVRKVFKRRLFRAVDGFVAIGSMNRAYYLDLGVPADRVYSAPLCVDNEKFSLKEEERTVERRRWRKRLGLQDDAIVILYAAKLVASKRPNDLLAAFTALAPRHPSANLVFAGAGDMEASLRHFAEETGLRGVRFVGFQNQTQLPGLYAAGDVFVLPSEDEPWGLAINEAMAAGLPVVVSDEVGAGPDLVDGMRTGLIHRCRDVQSLRSALERLLDSPELRKANGRRAQEVIKRWSIEASATGIVNAAMAAVCAPDRPRGSAKCSL